MKSSSNCEVSSGARGQKIVRSTGRDDSSFGNDENFKGGKMGGSTSNLGHSLTGAGAVQHVKGEK